MAHVADYALLGSVESTLRQCATAGMCADADFATDKATTLANIATRNTKMINSPYTRPDHLSMYYRLVEAVKLGFNVLGSTTMITDLATIYAAIGDTWAPGFAPSI